MTWTSRIPQYTQKFNAALAEGMDEAATIYQEEVRLAAAAGFKDGNFVTGELADSISKGPVEGAGGDYSIQVDTDARRKGDTGPGYPTYWEFGFHSIFSRKFERREIWRPAFVAKVGEMKEAIAEALSEVTV